VSEIFHGNFDVFLLIDFCTVLSLVKICKPEMHFSSSSNLFVSEVLPFF